MTSITKRLLGIVLVSMASYGVAQVQIEQGEIGSTNMTTFVYTVGNATEGKTVLNARALVYPGLHVLKFDTDYPDASRNELTVTIPYSDFFGKMGLGVIRSELNGPPKYSVIGCEPRNQFAVCRITDLKVSGTFLLIIQNNNRFATTITVSANTY